MVFGSRGALLSLIASVVANADPAQSFALDPLALYFAGNRLFGFALLDSADSLCVGNPSPHGWLDCWRGPRVPLSLPEEGLSMVEGAFRSVSPCRLYCAPPVPHSRMTRRATCST